MSISVRCPNCQKKLTAKDELLGKRVKCPACGQAIAIPIAGQPAHSKPVAPSSTASGAESLPTPKSACVPRFQWMWYAGGGTAVLGLIAVVAFFIALSGRDRSDAGDELSANAAAFVERVGTPAKDRSGGTELETKSLDYRGKWTGKENTGLHVRLISFEQNEFPCRGDIVVQYRSGSVMGHDIIWEKKDEELLAIMRQGERRVIAKVQAGQTLSGRVFLLVPEGGNSEIDFAAFAKQSEPPVTHESLMKDVPPLLAEVTNLLRTIQDETTAKQASPKIAALAQRLQDIKKKADALPKPSSEEEKRLQKLFAEEAKSVLDEMGKELNRIFAVPGVRSALAEPIREFQKLSPSLAASGRAKSQSRDAWRLLLLEDKVFTPAQIKQLENGGIASDKAMEEEEKRAKDMEQLGVTPAGPRIRPTDWMIHLNPTPKPPILLARVIQLYGKPNRVEPREIYDEKLAQQTAEVHFWGPIGLVTRKGQQEVIAFVAPTALYKNGLTKSARE